MIKNSRLQAGIGMNVALFPSAAAVQVAVSTPSSSKPELQEKVAVSELKDESPLNVTTIPLLMLGSGHRAARQIDTSSMSSQKE